MSEREPRQRPENSLEGIERLRKINLYEGMEDTNKFQSDVEFQPLTDAVLHVPEYETVSEEERFNNLVEQYGPLFNQVGLVMEYVPKSATHDSEFTPEEEKDFFTPRVDIHISDPSKFTAYLQALDGKSMSPQQAVGVNEMFDRLIQHLGTREDSVYSTQNPSPEMYNFLQCLPTISMEFLRIYKETEGNSAAEHEGYFYFGEEPEVEGATPPWHLGEDFEWKDLEDIGTKAGQITEAIKHKRLKEYLEG